MRRLACTCTLLVVANLAVTAWAADLGKIDRRIAREPVYGQQPKYCLLVFGPRAKTRVWLVIDGAVLYVDRNGNGNLTEQGEKVVAPKPANVYPAGDITEPDRGTKHTDLRVTRRKDGRMAISIRTESKYRQRCGGLTFADRPGKAPIVHFNGPVSVRFASAVADTGLDRMASALAEIGTKGPLKLGKDIPLPGGRRRSHTVVLSAGVGTPGLGEGTFATYKAREVLGQPNQRIAVKVGFPNQDAKGRPILVAGFLQPDS